MKQSTYAIAIDGPVAAGKGTISNLLAQKLNGFALNTGAMYRCVALFCLENNIPVAKQERVIACLPDIQIDMDNSQVFLNKKDVSERIKERNVSVLSSKIAAISAVREAMVKRQQEIGLEKMDQGTVVIAEGRDAATKIFPNALLKVFLTASAEIRANRRYEQMGGHNNHTISYEQILADTNERDKRDYERKVDPLVKDPAAYGYFVLDNSNLNEGQTVDAVVSAWEEKNAHLS